MAEQSAPISYSLDKNLFLYTSLTSGSSHIVTATSRLETILKANRIPFLAIDVATDDRARNIWGRRAGKDASGRVRKLPGLVQEGTVLGDLVEIEEWNEYGEMKMHVKIHGTSNLVPLRPKAGQPSGKTSKAPIAQENKKPESASATAASKTSDQPKSSQSDVPSAISSVLQQVGQEAAQKAKQGMKKVTETLGGVGQAEPIKKEAEPAKKEAEKAAAPAPISINCQSMTQPPFKVLAQQLGGKHQMPCQILVHLLPRPSAEEIKQVEEACAIPEEDEDEEETSDEDDNADTEKTSEPDVVSSTKLGSKEEHTEEEESDDSDESDDAEDKKS
ncbi:hypothetical protein M7I_3464 [Glarea lozoyensis 74030]|uniref:Thioredoxin-like protein n=1 Tax=Glarea lozoyensis (strain ATCC 74030 / MF5533) TaxID=1104152 RepID=H0ELK0_GLAL7|nr:hypothetical protein M7I_3464 [Glarea lozoyensis 74030]